MKFKEVVRVSILVFIGLINHSLFAQQKLNVMSEKNEKTELLQLDGAVGKLNVIVQSPLLRDGERCKLVVLMHGFMSDCNAELIMQIADKLVKNGVACVRFDFNGHGKSEGGFVDMTVPKEVKDAWAIYNYVRKLDYVSDIYLLGHSQGGVVASLLAGELESNVAGIVLMAPAAVLEDQAKDGTTLGAGFDPNNIPEYIPIFDRHLGREYLKSAQNLNIYQNAAKYKGRVSIIHGYSDEVVPYSYAEKYNTIYKKSELHLLDNENHSFSYNMNYATDMAVDFIVNRR